MHGISHISPDDLAAAPPPTHHGISAAIRQIGRQQVQGGARWDQTDRWDQKSDISRPPSMESVIHSLETELQREKRQIIEELPSHHSSVFSLNASSPLRQSHGQAST